MLTATECVCVNVLCCCLLLVHERISSLTEGKALTCGWHPWIASFRLTCVLSGEPKPGRGEQIKMSKCHLNSSKNTLIELLWLHSSSTTASGRAGVSCWAGLQQELLIMLQWVADWVEYNTSDFLQSITTDQHSERLHTTLLLCLCIVTQPEKTNSLPDTLRTITYHTVQRGFLRAIQKLLHITQSLDTNIQTLQCCS